MQFYRFGTIVQIEHLTIKCSVRLLIVQSVGVLITYFLTQSSFEPNRRIIHFMIQTSPRYSILFIITVSLLLIHCSDSATSVDPGSDNGNGSNPDPDPPIEFDHSRAPGASAEAFITSRTFDQLTIEIQYMPGAKPNEASISNLQDFLELHLEKASVTLLEPQEIESGQQESYTADDVRNIEEDNREEYTDENTLAAYVLFLDGEFESGSVLGIAYYNTSTAYFGDTIKRISGGLGQPSRTTIESTVFAHEFGHLMGLVNNGTEVQADHHDSENGAHCTVEECLMYFQVETTDFFANLFDGSILELDDFCLADIDAVKK